MGLGGDKKGKIKIMLFYWEYVDLLRELNINFSPLKIHATFVHHNVDVFLWQFAVERKDMIFLYGWFVKPLLMNLLLWLLSHNFGLCKLFLLMNLLLWLLSLVFVN